MAEKAASGGKGMMTTIVVILLLTLMGAGAGFAVGVVLQPGENAAETPPAAPAKAEPGHKEASAEKGHGAPAKEGEEAKVEDEPVEEVVSPKDLKILPIPTVLTTLAEPKGKWIRLEASILAKSGGEKTPEMLAEESGEQILAYLRTVKLAQIEGPSGLLSLRDDLDETLKTLSKGEVQGVLIHGLVVE